MYIKKKKLKEYYEKLNDILDDIFEEANIQGLSYADIAEMSDVSLGTIYNLVNIKTKYPYFRTVFLLAKAMGFSIQIIKLNKQYRLTA